MATIGDYIFLAIVLALVYGIYQGVTKGSPAMREELKRRQEELKKAGVNISGDGMSFKTDRRAPTREEYIDSAHRAFSTAGDTLNKHREAVSWGGDAHKQGSRHSAEEFFGKRHASSDGS